MRQTLQMKLQDKQSLVLKTDGGSWSLLDGWLPAKATFRVYGEDPKGRKVSSAAPRNICQAQPQLAAINCMRTGEMVEALAILGIESTEPTKAQVNIVDEVAEMISYAYSERTQRAPWRVYLKAAKMLEEVGL
jgi:hypothetical protein